MADFDKAAKKAKSLAELLGLFGKADTSDIPDHVAYLLSQGRTDEAVEAMKKYASGVRPDWDTPVPPRQSPEVRMRGGRRDSPDNALIIRAPDADGDAVRKLASEGDKKSRWGQFRDAALNPVSMPGSRRADYDSLRAESSLPRMADLRELIGYGAIGGGAAGLGVRALYDEFGGDEPPTGSVDPGQMTDYEYYQYLQNTGAR